MNPRRLYRSRERQLAGVAGGIAEYLDVDPTIVRVAWVLAVIASAGLALIAYLLLALVMPNAPYLVAAPPSTGPLWGPQPSPWAGQQPAASSSPSSAGGWSSAPASSTPAWVVPPTAPQWTQGTIPSRSEPIRQTRGLGPAGIVGIVLVVIGAIALLDVALPGLRAGQILGPAVIIALGAALLASSVRRPAGVTGEAARPMAAAAPTAPTAPATPVSPMPTEAPWTSESPVAAAQSDPTIDETRIHPLQAPTATDDGADPA